MLIIRVGKNYSWQKDGQSRTTGDSHRASRSFKSSHLFGYQDHDLSKGHNMLVI